MYLFFFFEHKLLYRTGPLKTFTAGNNLETNSCKSREDEGPVIGGC